jgi:ribosome-binding factor A
MPSSRQRKVQELQVHEVSEFNRPEIDDPDVGFVTITDAEVTPDLRHARIFFSVLGDEAQRVKTGKSLNRAAGFIRGQFARRAQLRYVPDFRFEYDVSVDRGARISQLLEQVRQHDEQAASSTVTGSDDDPGSD